MMFRRVLLILLAAVALWPTVALAGDYDDHPLLSGLRDYSVRSKSEKAFDVVTLEADQVFVKPGDKYSGPLSFEGKVTRLTYSNPEGNRSRVEIFRNYKSAIAKLGGRQLNSAPGADVNDWHVF